MHIWLTLPSLSKSGGGPANVVQNLSEQLALLGATVGIITHESEPGKSESLPRDNRVKVVHFPTGGQRRSIISGHSQFALEQCFGPTNETLVHDFGIWTPANHAIASACNRMRIPLISSPCGMLAPWALRHKLWKKRLAWWLYQKRDLLHSDVLVATSRQELKDLHSCGLRKPIALVPNGVEFPVRSALPQTNKCDGPRKAVFLGRIHSVKGLKNLVEAWNCVRPVGWRCVLAGPDEAGHQAELEALLRQRNLVAEFEFAGMVENERKWALLNEADLFVLPSFTENFGISVAEALACRVPVITTKGTPWNEIADHNCGWWVEIGIEPLATALREAVGLSDEQRGYMGQRGRRLVEENYGWRKIGTSMKAVYGWILGEEQKPDCVFSYER